MSAVPCSSLCNIGKCLAKLFLLVNDVFVFFICIEKKFMKMFGVLLDFFRLYLRSNTELLI
jgi:hypothetical protein